MRTVERSGNTFGGYRLASLYVQRECVCVKDGRTDDEDRGRGNTGSDCGEMRVNTLLHAIEGRRLAGTVALDQVERNLSVEDGLWQRLEVQ